jgi:hypothetical protein
MALKNPWETEPDYEYFEFAGVSCLVARMPDSGHVNGYIAIPNTHPWFGRELQAFRELNLEIHLSITYAMLFEDKGQQIYVVGFDTFGGYSPLSTVGDPERYYTFAWVTAQTQLLASQARAAGKVKFPRHKDDAWNYPWDITNRSALTPQKS